MAPTVVDLFGPAFTTGAVFVADVVVDVAAVVAVVAVPVGEKDRSFVITIWSSLVPSSFAANLKV